VHLAFALLARETTQPRKLVRNYVAHRFDLIVTRRNLNATPTRRYTLLSPIRHHLGRENETAVLAATWWALRIFFRPPGLH
jgi:hypothetical protein